MHDWGISNIPSGYVRGGRILNLEGTASRIEGILKGLGSKISRVSLSLACPEMITRTIYLPKMPPKELDSAVKYETGQLIPAGTGEYIFDYRVLGEEVQEGAVQVRVLIVALPASVIEGYLKLFRSLNLKPQVFDYHGNGVSRVVKTIKSGEKGERQVVVDAGASAATITIIENGYPVFTRFLQNGGDDMVQPASAERLVKDIYRSIEFYKSRRGQDIDSIIIAGGGSRLKDLAGQIVSSLELKEISADVELPPSAKGSISPELAAMFINVLGLALRGGRESGKNINLLPEEYRNRRKIIRVKSVKVLTGVLVCAAAASTVILPLYFRNSFKTESEGIRREMRSWNFVLQQRAVKDELEKLLAEREEMVLTLGLACRKWSCSLVEIARNTPTSIWLESVRLSGGRMLALYGKAPDYNTVAQYVVNLQNMKEINAVQPVGIAVSGDGPVKFEIMCMIGCEEDGD